MTNYRPISVMRMDCNLLTSIPATRLGYILPELIRPAQTAEIYDRQIGDSIKLIQTVIDKYKRDNEQRFGYIVSGPRKRF